MKVKPSMAANMLAKYIKAGLVPMMVGSPGCGKSQIVHQIAAQYGLKVIDLRLSQCEPTDLLGFPKILDNRAAYVAFEDFPIEGDPVPKGYNGWLLFLDEMNSAKEAVQAAAYKLVLDRMVGNRHLHKNVAIVCAGNLETDNAIVQPMSTALQSRMVHLELQVDVQEWLDWAATQGFDGRITSYINFKPTSLYTFNPDHSDKTYACPRTWEFANQVLKVTEQSEKEFLPMLVGTLSEGVAREFAGFCKIHTELPKPAEIQRNPEGIPVPEEPSILYALTGSIAEHAQDDNIAAYMKFVARLPKEFQVVCMRETVRRYKGAMKNPAVLKWVADNAVELF